MKKEKIFEILRYLSCSVVITVISWGSYIIFAKSLSVFLSNLLSWILATAAAFFVNKLWVFQSFTFKIKALSKEFATFISSRILSGAVEIAGVPLLKYIGFDKPFYKLLTNLKIESEILFTIGLYSKIAVGAIVLVLNYITAKIFVFKNKNANN